MEQKKEQLTILIQQAKALAGIYHKAIRYAGVSDNEFWIWYSLITLDDVQSQQDICQYSGIPKQTVNNIISAMVKKEYITLQPVPGTKNRKNICLTDAGRKHGEAMIGPLWEAESRAFARISDVEKAALFAVLSKYVDVFTEELEGITDF